MGCTQSAIYLPPISPTATTVNPPSSKVTPQSSRSFSRIPIIISSPSPSKYSVASGATEQRETISSLTSQQQLHLHLLPIELYSLILEFLTVSEIAHQECLHRPTLNNALGFKQVWRQKCQDEFSLYSSQGYRKVGGIVVSNRTHILSWKNLFKLRSSQPKAQYLQYRTSENDTYVIPINRASRKPSTYTTEEDQWFVQITSDQVMGSGSSGQKGALKRLSQARYHRGIDVIRRAGRGRVKIRSNRHINNKLRIKRANSASARLTSSASSTNMNLMVSLLLIFMYFTQLDLSAAGSNFEPISIIEGRGGSRDGFGSMLFGDQLCLEEPISGARLISSLEFKDRITERKWREERELVQRLYVDKIAENAETVENSISNNIIDNQMNQRYGTNEPPHECRESTYGELTHGSLQHIINHSYINILENESFLDLGSGRGATPIQVALSKNIVLSAGVELSKKRHNQACNSIKNLKIMKPDNMILKSTIIFSNEDMFTMDWTPFNVVYVSALCFRSSMMLEIKNRLVDELTDGSRVFSLREFPRENEKIESIDEPRLVLQGKQIARATWGPTTVYMYRKIGGDDFMSDNRSRHSDRKERERKKENRKSWKIQKNERGICSTHLFDNKT
jgi:hypothetical protein